MASQFLYRKLPSADEMLSMKDRYPDMEPSIMRPYLLTLQVVDDLFETVGKILGHHGLSRGRFAVLMMLSFHPELASTPSLLAEHMGVTRASVTGLLDGLEKDGYIVREHSADDRRSMKIVMTDKAREHMEDIVPVHFKRITRLMNHLDADERAALFSIMSKLQAGVEEIRAELDAFEAVEHHA